LPGLQENHCHQQLGNGRKWVNLEPGQERGQFFGHLSAARQRQTLSTLPLTRQIAGWITGGLPMIGKVNKYLVRLNAAFLTDRKIKIFGGGWRIQRVAEGAMAKMEIAENSVRESQYVWTISGGRKREIGTLNQ
jgi:hypothetical protein